MKREEREAYRVWLASLRKGDEVVVQHMPGGSPGGKPSIARVHFLTGDGRIMVEQERTMLVFKPNGRVRDRAFRGPMMLLPVDQELRLRTDVERARKRLGGLNWYTVGDAEVLKVAALLDEPEV